MLNCICCCHFFSFSELFDVLLHMYLIKKVLAAEMSLVHRAKVSRTVGKLSNGEWSAVLILALTR